MNITERLTALAAHDPREAYECHDYDFDCDMCETPHRFSLNALEAQFAVTGPQECAVSDLDDLINRALDLLDEDDLTRDDIDAVSEFADRCSNLQPFEYQAHGYRHDINEAYAAREVADLNAAIDEAYAAGTSPETLAELATHSYPWVRAAVALNDLTPPEVLVTLGQDPDSVVRARVAQHANTPTETLTHLADDEDATVRDTPLEDGADDGEEHP